MKFFTPITIAALSGLAAAASPQSADVFILKSEQHASSEQPRLPREVARHILLQRTSRSRYGSDLRDIPNTIDTETAVEYIARYGKSPTPLFTKSDASEPSQLVVLLEGVNPKTADRLKGTLGKPTFAISDPPSAAANTRLMTLFRNMGILSQTQCDLTSAINPFESNCWTGPSSVVKYDTSKSPSTVQSLLDNLPRINKFISSGDLEVVLILLPESSRSSPLAHWSAAAAANPALSRRQSDTETVITDAADDFFASAPKTKTPSSPSPLFRAGEALAKKPAKNERIPQCFGSAETCRTTTGNCSGNGDCVNKYGADDVHKCFVCACKATVVHHKDDPGSKGLKTIRWGGNKCQKEDISVQFWLIAGFTVTIIGAVGFAIGLLYSVGEETLPGVIGAGVSRGSSNK